jgi:hypothetical protein
VNRLIKFSLAGLIAMSAAGCTHEARITGPTLCYAPRDAKVWQMSQVAQARADLPATPTRELQP